MNSVKRWTQRGIVITGIALTALLFTIASVWALSAETPTAVTATAPDQVSAVESSVNWLVTTHQNDDGGYASFSSGANQADSTIGGSLDAIIAIASTGHNPGVPYPGKGAMPLGYLRDQADELAVFTASNGGQGGKALLALTASAENPRDFMGYNLVISVTAQLTPTGAYNVNTAFNQSLALLGLAAVGETAPMTATQWLKDLQAPNGSWDDGFGTADNADATAMAIMALVAQGEPVGSTTLTDALAFLQATQLASGGWEYGPGFGTSANSTALVVQALKALGEPFYAAGGAWGQGGNTPLTALLAFQSASGAFQADFGAGPFDDFFATVQSIPAATGRAFPLPARYEAASAAIACLGTLQDTATGGWEQFAGFGVNAAGTARAIEAIAAFGSDPQSAEWTPGTTNAVDALENLTPAYLNDGRGGRVGIVAQGVAAAGAPYTATSFAGFNLPISTTTYLSPTGEYDNTGFGPVSHTEAMLGLLAADTTPDTSAVTWLQNAAVAGDWGGADSNGIAINALSRTGSTIPFGAFLNLRTTQLADGGWGITAPSSVNSSAEVVQGLVAAGDNPFAPAWSTVISGTIHNSADAIIAQQTGNGCWPNLFGPGDDPFATTDGVLLLMADPAWPGTPSYYEYSVTLPLVAAR